MSSEIVIRFVEEMPFIPFEIYMANARVVRVPHPEFATLERFAHAVTVFEESGHAEVIDVELIASIRTLRPTA